MTSPIAGLEPLYGPQPWDPHQYGLAPDPMGGAAGYAYHPAFEGAMEVQAAEALYREVREVARRCAVEGRPCYVAETGTCDGYSTAFIARAHLSIRCRSAEKRCGKRAGYRQR